VFVAAVVPAGYRLLLLRLLLNSLDLLGAEASVRSLQRAAALVR
jgi:hypothetical protein